MHRVELKEEWDPIKLFLGGEVPNAPCGVERRTKEVVSKSKLLFLMHRVELKANLSSRLSHFMNCS